MKKKKKIFKIILYVVISLIVLTAIAIPVGLNYFRNKLSVDTFEKFSESKQLAFGKIIWHDGELNGQKVKRMSLFIPVKIEGISESFYMQFDIGSAITMFYSNALNEVIKSYPKIKLSTDKKGIEFLNNVHMELADNKLSFYAPKIRIDNIEGGSYKIDSILILGSIGYDAIINRTLILDFKNNQFAITKKSYDNLGYKMNLVDCSLSKFPVFINAKIGNESVRFFYDTGSSIFSALTSVKKFNSVKKAGKVDTLCCIHAWGQDYKVLRKKLFVPIKIGNELFIDKYLYATSQQTLQEFNYFPDWYIFGITGNILFNGKIIVIDTRNNKFGIVE